MVGITAVRQAAVYELGYPISRFGRSAWFNIRARQGSNVRPWAARSEAEKCKAIREAIRQGYGGNADSVNGVSL